VSDSDNEDLLGQLATLADPELPPDRAERIRTLARARYLQQAPSLDRRAGAGRLLSALEPLLLLLSAAVYLAWAAATIAAVTPRTSEHVVPASDR
jgi:hypothetical protein